MHKQAALYILGCDVTSIVASYLPDTTICTPVQFTHVLRQIGLMESNGYVVRE
jgi:hypothetical protein